MQTEAIPLSELNHDMQPAEHTLDQAREHAGVPNPSSWVDEHGDSLFRFAMVRLRDETLAQDLVQETLLSAIQSLDSYQGRSTERTWLTGILKHKIIDHYRKHKNQVQITDEETDLSGVNKFFERPDAWDGHWVIKLRPVDPEQSPDQAMERSEFWDMMNNCLSALPAKIANVFTLREVDGLTSEEICELLCLSPNNFWVIMHRARMQLRRCVEIKWFRRVI
ncbi:MAG: sigma-70 family RNA polymerase sigma factor [Pyrinomonadaceae bacterium]